MEGFLHQAGLPALPVKRRRSLINALIEHPITLPLYVSGRMLSRVSTLMVTGGQGGVIVRYVQGQNVIGHMQLLLCARR